MYKYECYLWFAERLNPNTSFWQLRWDLCFFFDSWNAIYQVCRSIVMDWKSMQGIFSLRLLSDEVD